MKRLLALTITLVLASGASASALAAQVDAGPPYASGMFSVLDTLGDATPDTRFSVYGSGGRSVLSWQNVGPLFSLAQPTVITEIGGFFGYNNSPLHVQVRASIGGAPDASSVLATFELSNPVAPLEFVYEWVAPNLVLPAGNYFAMFAPQGEDWGVLLAGATDPFEYRAGLTPMGFLDPTSGSSSGSPGEFGAVRILGLSLTYGYVSELTQEWVMKPGVAADLVKTLDAAARAEARGNSTAEQGLLAEYRHQLHAQTGKSINREHADLLVAFSQVL